MKRIVVGSGLIASSVVQVADTMASVIGSVPVVTLVPTGKWQNEANARVRIAQLKARFGPRKVRMGDFSDDLSVLRRDALVLGEDMQKAERKLSYVE
jgi:hypothetical protein